MKKIFNVVLSLMLMVCPISAYAEDFSESNNTVSLSGDITRGNSFPYSQSNPMYIDGTWRTIATSTSGFNCNVTIGGYTTTNYIDVRMKNSSGQVVWTGYQVIETWHNPTYGIFWCGSDVYSIQVRCDGGSGAGQAYAYQS